MPKVSEVFKNITTTAAIVNEDEGLEAVRKKMIQNPVSRSVYVVNKEKQFKGIITMKDIIAAIGFKEGLKSAKPYMLRSLFHFASKDTVAKDIMRAPLSITLNDSFQTAIQLMITHGYEEIAVVDDEGKVVGDLNAFEIINDIIIDSEKNTD